MSRSLPNLPHYRAALLPPHCATSPASPAPIYPPLPHSRLATQHSPPSLPPPPPALHPPSTPLKLVLLTLPPNPPRLLIPSPRSLSRVIKSPPPSCLTAPTTPRPPPPSVSLTPPPPTTPFARPFTPPYTLSLPPRPFRAHPRPPYPPPTPLPYPHPRSSTLNSFSNNCPSCRPHSTPSGTPMLPLFAPPPHQTPPTRAFTPIHRPHPIPLSSIYGPTRPPLSFLNYHTRLFDVPHTTHTPTATPDGPSLSTKPN